MWFIIAVVGLLLLIVILASRLPAQPQASGTMVAASPQALGPTTVPIATERVTMEQGQVVEVIDGDTIEVEIDGEIHRVRYIGMDAPERDEPFYDEATQANADLVMGQTVYLERDTSEEDRFGRLLRYVYVGERMVNAELVQRGLAVMVVFPPDVHHANRFRRLEDEARAAGLGLWAAGAAQSPDAAPSATSRPRADPTPSVRVVLSSPVRITTIFYDGLVPTVESDEYAEITNVGDDSVNLEGWTLDAGDEAQRFVFPAYRLAPDETCRVYTNESHAEWCGFSFESQQALWSNQGDCGTLFNAAGEEASRYCYE